MIGVTLALLLMFALGFPVCGSAHAASTSIERVVFSPDGGLVAVTREGLVRSGPAPSPRDSGKVNGKGAPSVFGLALSPDGKLLAAIGMAKRSPIPVPGTSTETPIYLWDTQTGREIMRLVVSRQPCKDRPGSLLLAGQHSSGCECLRYDGLSSVPGRI